MSCSDESARMIATTPGFGMRSMISSLVMALCSRGKKRASIPESRGGGLAQTIHDRAAEARFWNFLGDDQVEASVIEPAHCREEARRRLSEIAALAEDL